ncbi:hypothetical protein, partial [Thermomicrobium sp.]|uniref:hypothetical protein n=1 Tax=Thermomicrobium sp. TaxID=1969469 RepID=UPI00258003A2
MNERCGCERRHSRQRGSDRDPGVPGSIASPARWTTSESCSRSGWRATQATEPSQAVGRLVL